MKKTLLLQIVCFLLLMLGIRPCVQAGTTGLDSVVAALQAPFQADAAHNRIRDFQAAFTQEAYLSSLDQVQTAGGRVTVRFAAGTAGAPFRWEYLDPDPQLIVSDGRTVWVYLPDNRQVIESPLPADGRAGTDNPLAFLTDLGDLDRRFVIDWGEPRRTSAGNYRLLLRPRQPSAYLEQLLLEVDQAVVAGQSGFPLRTVTLFGTAENRTTVTFSDPRINQDPDPALFRFTPPPGTEVLHPEQGAFGQ